MAENSKIEWTDHTFNAWVGCTKVSAACDWCYAEGWAKRAGKPELWNGVRRRTSASNWRQPLKWNAAAEKAGTRTRVFCCSLADVFDNQVPPEWRADLFALIRATPALEWQLLTKRPQNILKMCKAAGGLPANAALGTTVENKEELDRVPHLVRAKKALKPLYAFLSIEPLLGPLSLRWASWDSWKDEAGEQRQTIDHLDGLRMLDWIIVGGESGPKARPMHPDWVRSLRDECVEAGVPFLFKQWGEWAPGECAPGPQTRTERVAYLYDNNWDFGRLTPKVSIETHADDGPDVWWFGKKAAGRLIDGREWNELPRVAA